MVQVSYPGVYVVEVSSGVHTITGVSTSVAAFFGRAKKGPMDTAIHCFSMADFDRALGGSPPDSDLAQSVRLFFANGGTECYVVRVGAGAHSAELTLQAHSVKPAFDTPVLVVRARSPGLWGNGLQLEVNYNTPQPDETFNLTAIQFDGDQEVARETHVGLSMDPASPRFAPAFVSASSGLVDASLDHSAGVTDLTDFTKSFPGFSQGRFFATPSSPATAMAQFRTEFENLFSPTRFALEISVDDSPWVPIDLSTVFVDSADPNLPHAVIRATIWSLADVANSIASVINAALLSLGLAVTAAWQTMGDVSALRISADTADSPSIPGKRSVRIRRAAANDIAGALMLGLNQGGIEPTRYSNFRPVPSGSYYQDVDNLTALAGLTRDELTSITIGSAPTLDLSHKFESPLSVATDLWFIDTNGGFDGVREKLRIIATQINAVPAPPASAIGWRAEVWGYHLAILARNGPPNTTPASIATVPSTLGDQFVRGRKRYVPTTSGSDGGAPAAADYEGKENLQTGFHALDPVDIFNLMVIPGDQLVDVDTFATVWGTASIYCSDRRAFLIIDPPPNWTSHLSGTRPAVAYDTSLADPLRATVVKENSAVFYPNIRFRDNGNLRTIGPAGTIAGLMARTDSTRGVWKAPAGLEAGLRAISDLEVTVTDRENGSLNKKGVNVLRTFPSGFVCWGSRTLAGDDDLTSEWKYVPIRRFALFLEESLFRGTKWVVFEPNDEPLWANIRKNLKGFMMGLFRQGAFQGATPDQAFYVKCDGETTTANDRNLGIVNIEVGFAPLKPAEFVVIKIQQIADPS